MKYDTKQFAAYDIPAMPRRLVMLAVATLVTFTMAGCVVTTHPDILGMRPSKKTVSAIRYLDRRAMPPQLNASDYRALESVVGRIPILGDPITVVGVFVEWQDVPVAVLYRTKTYDVYLVKDSNGNWLLSNLSFAPTP